MAEYPRTESNLGYRCRGEAEQAVELGSACIQAPKIGLFLDNGGVPCT